MTTPSHIITCKKKVLIAPGVYELKFSKPDAFSFKAGQFVLFDVPLIENPADIQPRAFSVASAMHEPELLFGVKLKAGGRASRWIEDVLEEKKTVRIQGPLGLFTVNPESAKHFVFVATGAGVAPFRSQLKWLLEEMKHAGKLDLIFGVRDQKDLFWTEEFERLAKAYPNFTLHLMLTGKDDAWTGKHGRVQTILPGVIADIATTHVYICGASEMVQDNKKFCLDILKMPRAQVHAEGYI